MLERGAARQGMKKGLMQVENTLIIKMLKKFEKNLTRMIKVVTNLDYTTESIVLIHH